MEGGGQEGRREGNRIHVMKGEEEGHGRVKKELNLDCDYKEIVRTKLDSREAFSFTSSLMLFLLHDLF